MTTAADRLGRGWAFPPAPDLTGGLAFASGPALVRQSVLLILLTEPGERVMRPEFGCPLRRHLMEPNNPTTRAAIARDVDAALRTWEPRIDLGAVDVVPSEDPATVLVTISYTHLRTQTPDGLQVPLTLAGG
ncbi:GPW/gp25 family protein [Modestobacter altitudinis]|uniref:GPW/gp25 family protein n=1 Tax=Modestobacter altitudinis TaxID=2213158 RepID=UPI00110CA96E|nr:GPW/gp25 family protein [Modestobacter altitudinis]